MSEADNPASRLIAILKKAQAIISQPIGSAAIGWARVFEINDPSSMEGQIELVSRIIETKN